MKEKQKSKFSKTPVILVDLPYKEPLFRAIYQKARDYGYGILDLRITYDTIPQETNAVGFLTGRFADDPMVCSLRKQGCHVVRIGRHQREEDDKEIQAILRDTSEAGILAADHFADRQFKNVGYVGHYPWPNIPHLYSAFNERALERGCKCHLLQAKPLSKPKATRKERFEYHIKQVLEWLKKLPKPIAIFTYGDLHAAGIYTTARVGGFEVPEDVAILGYGNEKGICDFLPVPLSSIDMNYEEQGSRAFTFLHELIQGKAVPSSPIMIPPKRIVVRQSTNLLAVEDPIVANALRYIWDNYRDQLSIDDIAAVTGVSRSMLTRKFRQCLGHGVNEELRRKRLERACKSLRSESYTIAEVAETSGFPSLPYFHIAFKNAFGITPGNYRKGINQDNK